MGIGRRLKEENAFLEPKVHADVDLYIENDNCIFLVAEWQEISGFILVKEFWKLTHFFVLPKFQGRGIGLALLKNAISLARKSGAKDHVIVNSSLNAVDFYERFGFKQDLERDSPSQFVKPMKYSLIDGLNN